MHSDRTITSLPWWMGVAIALAWLALMVAIVMIIRYRLRRRRASVRPTAHDDWTDRGLPERTGPRRELHR